MPKTAPSTINHQPSVAAPLAPARSAKAGAARSGSATGHRVPCPVEYCAGIKPPKKEHLVSQAELDANGGVCAKCREKFRKRARSQTSRTHDTEHHGFAENTAFVSMARGGSTVEPTVDPAEPMDNLDDDGSERGERDGQKIDFAVADGELQWSGLDSSAVQAVAKFCVRLIELGGRTADKFYETAHAFAFAAHIHPEQHLSGEEIATKYFKNPKTKQAFFKQVNRIRDVLGLPRIAGAKSNAARKTYRQRMKQSHSRRRAAAAHGGKSNGSFAALVRNL